MFENPDYQVDEQSEEFRLLNPIVSKVGQRRRQKLQQLAEQEAARKVQDATNYEQMGAYLCLSSIPCRI